MAQSPAVPDADRVEAGRTGRLRCYIRRHSLQYRARASEQYKPLPTATDAVAGRLAAGLGPQRPRGGCLMQRGSAPSVAPGLAAPGEPSGGLLHAFRPRELISRWWIFTSLR